MLLDYDFFKIGSQILPKQGRIIISEPFLSGNYFNRAIILLVEHSKDGAVGFILNKSVDFPIHEFLNEFPDFDSNVFIGGPVSTDVIYFIHTLGETLPGSIKVKDDLYWGGDLDELKSLINSGEARRDQVRFFLGYSGWGKEQLEKEIAENSWLVSETSVESIMKSSENYWKECVSKLGGKYELWKNYPEDPNWN
jgi:putative transcriptional regulator